MPDFYYQPVGRCIYCPKSGVQLTDEHIIPYGLNGDRILPQSTCSECADVTSRIERKLLRGEMAQVRAALGFKSYRPKKVPKSFPMFVVRDGEEVEVDAPIADHLILLPLPLFRPPAFFSTYNYAEGIASNGLQMLRFGPDPEELVRRYNAERVGIVAKVDQNAFAQLLAKMGHAIVAAELGLNSIVKSYVLPCMFGDMSEAGLWIGSNGRVLPAIDGVQHTMRVRTFDVQRPNEQLYSISVATIRLFANNPTPEYTVVVGENRRA